MTIYRVYLNENGKWATDIPLNHCVKHGEHYVIHTTYNGYDYVPCSDYKQMTTEIEDATVFIDIPMHEKWCIVEGRACKIPLYDGSYYDKNLEFRRACEVSRYIELDNGTFLKRDYDKYGSHLCLLLKEPHEVWVEASLGDYNIANKDPRVYVQYGQYFVSKKGTKCFRITDKEHATHHLLNFPWSRRGGDKYLFDDITDGVIYKHNASSHGGGIGNTYVVVKKDWKYTLSEDDI